MKRELTLEDYFELKPEEANDRVQDIADMLNVWEPTMRSNIEQILMLGQAESKHDATVALLARLNTLQGIQTIRRYMTGEDEYRDVNLKLLLLACAQNFFMNYDTRYETIEYYVDNPRFKITPHIAWAMGRAFAILVEELKSKCENMYRTLSALEPYSREAGEALQDLGWFAPFSRA
jgi:hypothetical protein